jgi:hypothetical protein
MLTDGDQTRPIALVGCRGETDFVTPLVVSEIENPATTLRTGYAEAVQGVQRYSPQSRDGYKLGTSRVQA